MDVMAGSTRGAEGIKTAEGKEEMIDKPMILQVRLSMPVSRGYLRLTTATYRQDVHCGMRKPQDGSVSKPGYTLLPLEDHTAGTTAQHHPRRKLVPNAVPPSPSPPPPAPNAKPSSRSHPKSSTTRCSASSRMIWLGRRMRRY